MEKLRERLLEELERKGISDPAVLRAMANTPREMFISQDHLKSLSYDDAPLPIECEQTISQPFVVAYMTERMRILPEHDVLEIGTGSGYQTAILAQLARHVYTIERHPALHGLAVERFRQMNIGNITAIAGDGTRGWPHPRLFDRILVAAAARRVPRSLLDQLTPSGAIIIPLGRRCSQWLTLIVRIDGRDEVQRLLPVRFVPLLTDD